jgi:hypothetical protein
LHTSTVLVRSTRASRRGDLLRTSFDNGARSCLRELTLKGIYSPKNRFNEIISELNECLASPLEDVRWLQGLNLRADHTFTFQDEIGTDTHSE